MKLLPSSRLRAFPVARALAGAALLFLGAPRPPAQADPAAAEDDAYKMATTYTARGFAMSPTNHNGVGGSGYTVRFLIPVSKGLDYVFLCGVDNYVQETGIYVYDEVGGLILDDRRGGRRAGVKFRSSYNGTVQVYLNLGRARGLGSYSVLVGRRGEEKREGEAVTPQNSANPLP